MEIFSSVAHLGDGTYINPDFFLLDTIIESVVGPGIGVRGLYDFVIEIDNLQAMGANAGGKNVAQLICKINLSQVPG